MAWCDECDTLVEDEELGEEGECPNCGTILAERERRPIPWYFKLMIVATIVYLGYRGYQGVAWIAAHV